MKRPITRRRVLRAGAALTIGLPFLPSLAPKAAASGDELPKRLLILLSANGVVPEDFFPAQVGQDFSLPFSTAPLEPFREQLLVLDGIDSKTYLNQSGNGHTKAGSHTLTCVPHITPHQYTKGGGGSHSTGISIDQEIANANATPIHSLQVGYKIGSGAIGETPRQTFSSLGYNQPLQPQGDPQQVFDQLAGFVADGATGAAELERLRAQQRSVLDLAMRDIEALQPSLSAVDAQRLDRHLTQVRELEQSLADAPPALGCEPIEAPGTDLGLVGTTEAMRDLIALAFRCDLTRVATFQWAGAQSGLRYTEIGVEGESHHEFSHYSGNAYDEPMRRITRFHIEQMAGFADALAGIEDDETCTALDNTIVVYINPHRTGNGHQATGLPIVTVGGSNLGLRGGESMNMDGASLNDLYITLANALGVPLTTFGDPQWVDGGLPSLLA